MDAETPIGPYRSECVFFLHMGEDCEELVGVEEFVDTAVWNEFWPRMQVYASTGVVVRDGEPNDSGPEDDGQ